MKLLYVMNDGPGEIHALQDVLAQARKCQANLLLLDVIDTVPALEETQLRQPPQSQRKNALLRERLAQLESFVLTNGADAGELRARVLFGKRAHEITRTAAESAVDLVIKQREPGTTDRLLAQYCPCPVLLYAPDTHPTVDAILGALPGMQHSRAVA